MNRATQNELKEKLLDARERVEVGGIYVHYKHPEQQYIVRSLVLIEETEEVGVVYEAQYGEKITWMRPLENFCELASTDNGKVARFARTK